MNRRQFLTRSLGGLLLPAAPAICRAEWLMPVRAPILAGEALTEARVLAIVAATHELMAAGARAMWMPSVNYEIYSSAASGSHADWMDD